MIIRPGTRRADYVLRLPGGLQMELTRGQGRRATRAMYARNEVQRVERAPGARFYHFANGCVLRLTLKNAGRVS